MTPLTRATHVHAQLFTLVKSKSVRSPGEPFLIALGDDSLTLVERLLVATARLGSAEALVEPAGVSGRVWTG